MTKRSRDERVLSQKRHSLIMFLSMFYITVFLAAAILAHKLVYFGHYMTSVSTFVLPLSFVLSDIIAEVYGYAYARQLIWSSLFCEVAFALIMLVAVNIDSPSLIKTSDAYHEIFGSFIRISIGNVIAMLTATFINVYLLTKWKMALNGKLFWLRSLGSSSIGEFVFTFICVIISFYGVVDTAKIPQLILTSFIFKIIFNPIAVVPANIYANWLKRTEDNDHYDLKTNFNPFNLSISDQRDG